MTLYIDLALLNAYREDVKRTSSDARSFRDRLVYGAMGIISETGELVGLVEAQRYPDFHPRKQVTPEDICDEAGDVAFYVAFLLNLFDIASERIDWPEHEPPMSVDVVYTSLDCSMALGTVTGTMAWMARQHITHRIRIRNASLEAGVNRACGKMLHYLMWLLHCYHLTLHDALDANVTKRAVRFPDEVVAHG